MTFFDWLASPIGTDLIHAVIVLILAGAAYLQLLTHRDVRSNRVRLNGHMEWHARNTDAARRLEGGGNVQDR